MECTRPAVEVVLHEVDNIAEGQTALLHAVGLREQEERLGDANRVRQMPEVALARVRHESPHLRMDRCGDEPSGRPLASRRCAALPTSLNS